MNCRPVLLKLACVYKSTEDLAKCRLGEVDDASAACSGCMPQSKAFGAELEPAKESHLHLVFLKDLS